MTDRLRKMGTGKVRLFGSAPFPPTTSSAGAGWDLSQGTLLWEDRVGCDLVRPGKNFGDLASDVGLWASLSSCSLAICALGGRHALWRAPELTRAGGVLAYVPSLSVPVHPAPLPMGTAGRTVLGRKRALKSCGTHPGRASGFRHWEVTLDWERGYNLLVWFPFVLENRVCMFTVSKTSVTGFSLMWFPSMVCVAVCVFHLFWIW